MHQRINTCRSVSFSYILNIYFDFMTFYFNIMFIPKNEAAVAETREAEQARREAYSRIEAWVLDAIPANYRRGAVVSVQEVVCGDPSCSPVDTAIAILFEG